ncbi:MAG TPA: hypothetical protein VGM67_01990 [Gemmatimonadaceae bacterium]|jgi:hypothetical protein
MIARLLIPVAAFSAVGFAAAPRAQQQPTPCNLVATPTTRLSSDSTPAGRVTFIGGGVLFRCPDRGITLRGDSAEQYPDHDYIVGHAIYDEPRFHVTSDFLNYFPSQEIVKAVANVVARSQNGSTLRGPYAEYRRPLKGVRPHEQMYAVQRPTIDIVQKDTAKKDVNDTTVVVANQVFMDGDSLIYAGGQVVITRPEIVATADSSFIDQPHDVMHLMRNPILKGTKAKPFTLTGDLIDLYSTNHKLNRVMSRANAVAVNDSMTLKSDTIDLRVVNNLLDHAYAWGAKSRARVISPSQNVLADSLDVSMPGQKLRLVRAVRKAFADARPDTTKFQIVKPDTTDWLKGDTIVAHFDTVPPKDTTKSPPIRLLVSTGGAASYYHMASSDSGERRPSINYVTAHRITITFDSQKVATVAAEDSVVGTYVEAKQDSAARKAKTTPAAPGKPGAKSTAAQAVKPGTSTAPPKTPPKTPPPTTTAPSTPPAKPPASFSPKQP